MIQSAPPAAKSSSGGDGGEDDGDASPEDRPPWHWIGFGTIVTFACWLPLAYVAEAVRSHVFQSRFGAAATREEVEAAFAAMSAAERFRWTAMQTLPHIIAFALGAFAGGLLVGRFGTGASARENQKLAAASGVVTALVALAVSWRVLAEGGWGALASMVLPLVVAVGFAWWGGRVATRRRAKNSASPGPS